MRATVNRQPVARAGGIVTLSTLRRSAVALGISALLSGPLYAQTADTEATEGTDAAVDLSTVVVTGIRGSVMRAQEIKQEATQIVDSVTAEDIGALPDRSVTETLKRISGVTVTGFLARDDTDHFSAEGSGVMIRGLTFVRGELNGRDVFSANGGRGINFEEIPSELMAGVDIYKNPSAEIIEGGLGGTVNLRTRMPFDEPGRKIAGSIDYNYGDHAKDGRPSASLLFSDRWQTGAGEFGFLANFSYSELATLSDGIQIEPFVRRGVQPEHDGGWVGLPDGNWVSPEDNMALLFGDSGHDVVFTPGGANWRQTHFDRKRQGVALAGQWRPNDDTEFYTQYLNSKYRMAWRERSMVFGGSGDADNADGRANTVMPALGTQFTYDERGRFLTGTLRASHYPWHGIFENFGIQFSTANRYNTQETETTDWSAGFRHFITDNLIVRGDFQYVTSESNPVDFTVYASTLLEDLHLDLTGKYPAVTIGDTAFAEDPGNYFWRAAMDHIAENRGVERAGRVDLEYTFDDARWLRFVRFGARVADREYDSKSTHWNWQAISEAWRALPDGSVAWLDQYYPQDSELYSLGNFFRGDVNVPRQLWFPTDRAVDIDYAATTLAELARQTGDGTGGWSPIQFQPQHLNTQRERTQAVYGIVYFENDTLALPVDGNIGVRVVKTSVNTTGGGRMPDLSSWSTGLTDEVRNHYRGEYFSTDTTSSYTDVLPSLNLRFKLAEGLQWRLAVSKAIARPEFRLMQAWLPLSVSVPEQCGSNVDPQDPDSEIIVCGRDDLVNFSGAAGNPALEPMRANQFDTALEWYFGPTNMLYATLFYKDVKGYFATTAAYEEWNGDQYLVTRTNNLDQGKIRGVEVGYSQFFDFLPGWLSGFGVQANYTYVDSSGGTNAIVDPYDLEHRAVSVELPLEGLSKRSYNVVGVYEKNRLSFRLAYNWRSRYLLTSSDVITQLPTWNEDFGQLDGSFFYNLTENIQIGLQVNNITNSVTNLTTGPRLYPTDDYLDDTVYNRAWFMNDRRYSAVLRASW